MAGRTTELSHSERFWILEALTLSVAAISGWMLCSTWLPHELPDVAASSQGLVRAAEVADREADLFMTQRTGSGPQSISGTDPRMGGSSALPPSWRVAWRSQVEGVWIRHCAPRTDPNWMPLRKAGKQEGNGESGF